MNDQISSPMTGGADESLWSIVYASIATVPFSELDLALLLASSRSNNDARGLTGVLLYRNGQFMQALEGPQRAVRSTLATIAADPRHSGVWTLDETPVSIRRFGTWAMGYRVLTVDELANAPHWFGSPEALREQDDSHASELLTWFKSH